MRKPTRQQIVRELRHREKHAFDEMAKAAADLIEKQAVQIAECRAALSADGGEVSRLRGKIVELNEALHAADLCEGVSQDAPRLDFMAHHGASLRKDPNKEVGWFVVIPYHTGTVTDAWPRFATPREAIDAAIAANQAKGDV